MKQLDRKWRPFVEARAFVRRLGFTSRVQWRLYCRSGERPSDIPSAPERVYSGEFQGWGDWFGKCILVPFNRKYRTFTEARAFVHELHLKNRQEWQTYCQAGEKPIDIPSSPGEVYKNEFRGWGDWLDTGNVAPRDRVYLPFAEARDFVHQLGLKNQKQWRLYSKSDQKPANIPAAPDHAYGAEFQGFGNWLGTGTVGPHDHEYRPFKEARNFVHRLGFSGRTQWRLYCRSGERPRDIPSAPERVYRGEFQGWGDWLGTGTIAPYNREYRSFTEARAFVHTLHLKNRAGWRSYCQSGTLPDNIPPDPQRVYGSEFQGMGDWLGTGYIAHQLREYLPFAEARAFVHTLRLKGGAAWKAYCKSGEKPDSIPTDPRRVYEGEFEGMGDWLETGTVAPRNRKYRPFEGARAFVHTLGLKNRVQWQAYCKTEAKPNDIPTSPGHTYGLAFQGWGDWLGTGTIAPFNREYLPFAEARAFVHALRLKSSAQWRTYCKSGRKPEAIPTDPRRVYKSEFQGWGDWLGTGYIANQRRKYLSFEEARAVVHALNLKNRNQWKEYCASGGKPSNIPTNPNHVYRSEFRGWGDWLGTGAIAVRDRVYLPFVEARAFVHMQQLKNLREWREYCVSGKKPENIPANPQQVYKSDFLGMGDWLGTGNIAYGNRAYRPYAEARAFVHTLDLKSRAEWEAYCKSGEKPDDIPAGPWTAYGSEFQGWGDWLGTGTIAGKDRKYRTFLEARAFVRTLGLQSRAEWDNYCKSGKKPDDIPANPYGTYASEFLGMGDWLGTDRIANQLREYLPFLEARAFVHTLKLTSQRSWIEYCKSGEKPANIPSTPSNVYPSEYMGIEDWLGTDLSDSSVELYTRQKRLEVALIQLHSSQLLSAGQVMILMRHAGSLSVQRYLHTIRRLQTSIGQSAEEIQTQLAAIEAAIEGSDEEGNGQGQEVEKGEDWDSCSDPLIGNQDQNSLDLTGQTSDSEEKAPSAGSTSAQQLSRDRDAEIKELRGWSAVGNILDPTPALVQLSVTRLKTAFYRFANELRGTLTAPSHAPSEEEIEELKRDLWHAAFGEYGALIDNDLIHEACQAYITELAEALLLPRLESKKIPRLYQLDGARFLAYRLRAPMQPYGLLFDQPGMGKTLTTLWALAAAGIERFIIVAPLTVKTQVWTFAELRIAFPYLEEASVARDLDAALRLPRLGPAVALLHYEELRRHEEIKQIAQPRVDGSRPFDALVFDEAHNVKERLETRPSAQRTGAWLLRKGVRACIGLTATPIVNELYEPVSLLHLVQDKQDSSVGKRLQSRRLRDRVDVMEYLLADSLRRLKEQVLFEIPPRHIEPFTITPTAEYLEQIKQFLSRGRRSVGASLAEYRRLMLDVKLEWITDRVNALRKKVTPEGLPDPKVLILCCNVEGISRSVYSALAAEIGSERIAHIDGTTPQQEREEILKHFRAPGVSQPELSVLVGTVGTIGVGVTLFDAEAPITPHRVIFADLPFTWAEFEQGIDRLHRVGQRFPVQVDVPLVSYGEQLSRTDGASIQSFDEWVWAWICKKQVLSDQVLDAEFDISGYKDSAIRRAISQALKDIEKGGGTIFAPLPPPDSSHAEHRRLVGRYRALPRHRVAELFREAGVSERFLAVNDASPSAHLAQRLVRERLARWLDNRSVVIDLGCGSNPLRDLPCAKVTGVDRHGVNGGLIGDSACTGLPAAEADFVVFSLSMWGTAQDRLSYLREAKRLLRPIGKLIIVEPAQSFGDSHTWKAGATRLAAVLEKLGMKLTSASEHIVDTGTRLVAFVADNSTHLPADDIDPNGCIWNSFE